MVAEVFSIHLPQTGPVRNLVSTEGGTAILAVFLHGLEARATKFLTVPQAAGLNGITQTSRLDKVCLSVEVDDHRLVEC